MVELREKLVDVLIEAARGSAMPAGEQLRFESMLNQMSGRQPHKDPLPRAAISALLGREG
jgi:hypothetical protein